MASGRSRFELEEQEMLRGMTFDGYLTNNGQIVYDGPVSDVNEEILNNIYEGKLEQEVAG